MVCEDETGAYLTPEHTSLYDQLDSNPPETDTVEITVLPVQESLLKGNHYTPSATIASNRMTPGPNGEQDAEGYVEADTILIHGGDQIIDKITVNGKLAPKASGNFPDLYIVDNN